MTSWVAAAARETATTATAGTGLLHGIAPGAITGFAVGALLTGVCCLVIVAPRLLRRPRPSARDGMWAQSRRHARVRRDYFAAPVAAAELSAPVQTDSYPVTAGGDPYAVRGDQFGRDADDDVVLPGLSNDDTERAGRGDTGRTGYRSKHRLTGSDEDRRTDARRTQPRHAAPPAGLGSWVSGRFAALPVGVRG